MANDIIKLFEKFLYEAPEEDPPDVPADVQDNSGPPDVPDDISEDNDVPDIDMGDDNYDNDEPPNIDSDDNQYDDSEFGDENNFEDNEGENQESDNNSDNSNMELDEKISAIMNMNLYQRFLSLLNNIGSQLNLIKNNGDMLYTISSNSLEIVENLKKLDENIRLYLKNNFLNENYSKNLLFFNKCLNLLKLLNDEFDKSINKGIKSIK